MDGADSPVHVPVLLPQVLDALAPRPGGRYVDATANGGGHLRAVLDACAPDGRVLGIDRDPEILTALAGRCAEAIDTGRLILATGSFAALGDVIAARQFGPVDGILFDLGLSSFHLDASGRGFSYTRDEPLDMRFDPTDDTSQSAADILAKRDGDELAAIFRDYGEERFASRIAAAITRERAREPFTRTGRLAELVRASIPAATRRTGGHPAKRTFQALRIEVNGELDALRAALPAAIDALAVGGRIVVLAYHSLEDRMVKRELAERARSRTPVELPVELPGHGPELRLLTRGAEVAGDDETADNPRAASVRLRAAERIGEAAA